MEIDAVAEALAATGLLGENEAWEAAYVAIEALDHYRSSFHEPPTHRELRLSRCLSITDELKIGDMMEIDEGIGAVIYCSERIIGLLLDKGGVSIIERNTRRR